MARSVRGGVHPRRERRRSARTLVGVVLVAVAWLVLCGAGQAFEPPRSTTRVSRDGEPAQTVERCRPERAIAGRVVDESGAVLSEARVVVTTASGAVLGEARAASDGVFRVCGIPPIDTIVTVEHDGFRAWRRVVAGDRRTALPLAVVMALHGFGEMVTVTPAKGEITRVSSSPAFVTVARRDDWQARSGGLLAVQARVDAGLHVQQTSTSQTSPYVRGLTGQRVVTLIDGVRFNTTLLRPGANQYTALVDAGLVDRVEVVHGPVATQYGSDALGGAIQVVTRPAWQGGRQAGSGTMEVDLASADESVGIAVSGGGAWSRVSVLGHFGVRRVGDLRTGGGRDSHSVATRLLGLPSSALGSRLQQTAFRQRGANLKAMVRLADAHVVTGSVLGASISGASRYDMLDGGTGNLLHRFDPQTLRLAWVRYEGAGLGPLTTVSATVSFNAQRDDRIYQNINNAGLGLMSALTTDRARVAGVGTQVAVGVSPSPRHRVRMGVDLLVEGVEASRVEHDPTDVPPGHDVRPRVPNGARYASLGVFAQDSVSLWADRVSVMAGARSSRVRYRQRAADNPVGAVGPLVADADVRFDDLSGHLGVAIALASRVTLTTSLARGFRAPNTSDLGNIGIAGGGFEIAPDEAMRVGAAVARRSASGAARRVMVDELQPETLASYDVGVRVSLPRVSLHVSAFLADLRRSLERQTVLLPDGAVGTLVGGQRILRQDPDGAVYTPASGAPVFVRVNGDGFRLRGLDAHLSGTIGRAMHWSAHWSTVRGENRADGSPPDIENGLPAGQGSLTGRWTRRSGRVWVDGVVWGAMTQRRLSTNDLRQARIGGWRTPQEIRDFFNNGATIRGLVVGGRLVATGETLDEVTRRVLGESTGAPLFTSQPGFAVVSAGAGWRITSRVEIVAIIDNLFDRNYRTMGSGVDGAGRSVVIRQRVRF